MIYNSLSQTNEIQTISLAGSTVTLSDGGGSFDLPADQVDDADADPANETEYLSRRLIFQAYKTAQEQTIKTCKMDHSTQEMVS
jgi:hypothetical protein